MCEIFTKVCFLPKTSHLVSISNTLGEKVHSSLHLASLNSTVMANRNQKFQKSKERMFKSLNELEVNKKLEEIKKRVSKVNRTYGC